MNIEKTTWKATTVQEIGNRFDLNNIPTEIEIKKGDTLWNISLALKAKYPSRFKGLSVIQIVNMLMSQNNITDPKKLMAGKMLSISTTGKIKITKKKPEIKQHSIPIHKKEQVPTTQPPQYYNYASTYFSVFPKTSSALYPETVKLSAKKISCKEAPVKTEEKGFIEDVWDVLVKIVSNYDDADIASNFTETKPVPDVEEGKDQYYKTKSNTALYNSSSPNIWEKPVQDNIMALPKKYSFLFVKEPVVNTFSSTSIAKPNNNKTKIQNTKNISITEKKTAKTINTTVSISPKVSSAPAPIIPPTPAPTQSQAVAFTPSKRITAQDVSNTAKGIVSFFTGK